MTTIANRITHTLTTAIIAGTAVAGPTMLLGATAKAPEPAPLGTPTGSSTGATGAATYVSSPAAKTYVVWPSSWAAGTAPAGTPCSNVPLLPGQVATKVIQVIVPGASQRRCI